MVQLSSVLEWLMLGLKAEPSCHARHSLLSLQQLCSLQDAAKRAEAAAAEAKASVEAKSTELTRARAELLSVREQLAAVTRAMDAQQLQALLAKGTELASGVLPEGVVIEGMAARLAAAQVMRREAEDQAAQLARKLSGAEKQLAELQQQQGESEVAASELGGQLSVTAAQLARSKAEAVAQRAAAEGGESCCTNKLSNIVASCNDMLPVMVAACHESGIQDGLLC